MTQRRTAWVVALIVVPALAACSFFACGGPEFTEAAGQDGGAGATVEAGTMDAGSGASDSSPVADAAPGPIVYVSQAAGLDSNSGFSAAAPKKSLAAGIAAGIAAAASLDAGVEVHACAGTYAETDLVINAAVSLRGAYSCTDWTRTATFGFPTFDHSNDTVVQNASPTAQTATLLVSNAVPAATTIDGLVIEGAASSTSQTIGVLVKGTASPLLADDLITGGAGHPSSGDGSFGLSIQGAAAPVVMHDGINGGTGTGTIGSIGVVINSSGAPNVHDNLISGGLGTSTATLASLGINVQSSVSGANALANNIVLACDSAGVIGSADGISITDTDASVDITGSEIAGCVGTGDAGTGYGIHVNSRYSAIRIVGDRVYGGARAGAASFVAGVYVQAASALALENSMVHAGDVVGDAGSSSTGVSLGSVASASIVDDTIYGGPVAGTPIVLLAGETNATITDVMLLGAGPTQAFSAIFANDCAGVVASLDHDLFTNLEGDLFDCGSTDGGASSSAKTVAQLASLFPTAATDLVYATPSVCDDDAGCVETLSCPGPPTACLGSLFGPAWTADDGITGLFATPDGGTGVGGWALRAGAPCAIAHGGIAFNGITTDLYGVARSAAAPTIGAAELVTGCTP